VHKRLHSFLVSTICKAMHSVKGLDKYAQHSKLQELGKLLQAFVEKHPNSVVHVKKDANDQFSRLTARHRLSRHCAREKNEQPGGVGFVCQTVYITSALSTLRHACSLSDARTTQPAVAEGDVACATA
jgi:hypothetical protein